MAALAWNACLGLSTLLIPLHAGASGLSAAAIGGLLGLPAMVQLGFLLLGGAYADSIGGRKVMLASCFLFALCAGLLLISNGLFAIAIAQVFLVMARSVFWPALWALIAEVGLDGKRGVARLNALTNVGQLLGTSLAGLVAAVWGLAAGFVAMIASVALCAILVQTIPARHAGLPKPVLVAGGAASTYMRYLRLRSVHYANLCSFVSAVPLTLASSFIPLLLINGGMDVDAAGAALSMRAVGAVFAGVLVVHAVTTVPNASMASGVAAITAVCLLALSSAGGPFSAGLVIFVLGFAAAAMNLYFQLLLAAVDAGGESRGSLMAVGSLGVIVSHICMPVIAGYVTGAWGIQRAFAVAACIAAACALALPLLQRRSFRA